MLWNRVVDWLDKTPWGRLQQIEVRGLERLPESDILAELEIEPGVSLMSFPFDSVANRITALPSVKNARVLRRLPGRLIIKVEERRPIAALVRGEIMLVDREGVAFPLIGSGEVINLPVLNIPDCIENQDIFSEAVALISDVNTKYPVLYDNLSEVTFKNSGIELRIRTGGAQVRYSGELDANRLVTLEAFLQQKGKNLPGDLSYIDLRFDRMIVTGTG